MRKSFALIAAELIPSPWVIVLATLIAVNLGWLGYNSHRASHVGSLGGRFKVVTLRSNDISGLAIVEANTDKPLWIEWNPEPGKGPHIVSFFFRGTNVLNLRLDEGHQPGYDVLFHGAGKSQTWWWDHSSGEFTERILYDSDGKLTKHEAWFDNAWRPVERRGDKNGIILDGQWQHLQLTTNGAWTVKS